MTIDRFWAMPSKNTFSIPAFRSLIEQYRKECVSIKSELLCAGPRRFDSVNLHEELFLDVEGL